MVGCVSAPCHVEFRVFDVVGLGKTPCHVDFQVFDMASVFPHPVLSIVEFSVRHGVESFPSTPCSI
jgi:hypothetical protein